MLTGGDWAEIRRLHRAENMPIKAIARTLGISRNTVRAALASDGPPQYRRASAGSAVDAFEPRIRKLLQAYPTMPATVIAERIGWDRGLTVLKERVRELRPAYLRTKQHMTSLAVLAGFLTVLGTVQACSTLAFGAGAAKGTGSPVRIPAATSPAAHVPAVQDAVKACGGLPAFSKATAGEIMAGKLTISPFATVTVDPAKSGDIDWSQNPFNHPTWQQDFQSGGWIEMLIAGYLAGGADAKAYLARAEAITKSWLKGVSIADRDPQAVICLSEGFPGQKWIDDQIDASVNYLAAHWQGPWNHGLGQDLKLMRIGCAYPAAAFGGDALKWRQTADSQILSSFYDSPRLGPSVDPQGVVNEQATGYEHFVYDLWYGGEPELKACGYPLPADIAARIAKMPEFLAEATQPDGNFVQIGDTYQESGYLPSTHGLPARPPLVAVYDAGYIFGRSEWGPNGTFYSLRFGPARQVHGHNDHMGITYYSRGRNLIVNAGHTGYEVSAYRDYIRSPEAASTFISPGTRFYASQSTQLVADKIGATSQYYELSDHAFGGGQRTRSVYAHQGPDFLLVLDRGLGNSSYQQLWHLDPSLTVTSLTPSSATATAPAIPATGTSPAVPATALHLIQIPLPGQDIPTGSTTKVEGETGPYQGWVSRQALQRTPAPVVIMSSQGTGPILSTQMLTLIAATAPGTPVSATGTTGSGGSYDVTVHIGSATVPVTIPSPLCHRGRPEPAGEGTSQPQAVLQELAGGDEPGAEVLPQPLIPGRVLAMVALGELL